MMRKTEYPMDEGKMDRNETGRVYNELDPNVDQKVQNQPEIGITNDELKLGDESESKLIPAEIGITNNELEEEKLPTEPEIGRTNNEAN